MTRVLPLVALSALVLVVACGDSTRPQAQDSQIRGVVLDAADQPVAGAAVILQHDTDTPVEPAPDKPQSGIVFQLPEDGHVLLWIGSICDGDTVRILADDDEPSGQHTYVWDGLDRADRTMPDGAYRFHMRIDDGDEQVVDFLLLHLGYGSFGADHVFAPLAVTDAHGAYALDQGCLPFGFTQTATDELGNPIGTVVVTRRVRVWAFSGATGEIGASGWVTVDSDTGAEVSITVDR